MRMEGRSRWLYRAFWDDAGSGEDGPSGALGWEAQMRFSDYRGIRRLAGTE